MHKSIFDIKQFHFPYTDIRFPGMNNGEKILFITREGALVFKLKIFIAAAISIFICALGLFLIQAGAKYLDLSLKLKPVLFVFSSLFFLVGLWWINEIYRKSLFIITTRRLTKIIYTTPFTWYQFSLGLDEIQDTGSYGSSFVEALFGLGYFVARSGAGALKNFKIVNICYARDLHNYVNKLLFAFKHHADQIDRFRPFIPNLGSGEREAVFAKYPEYTTEFH